MKTKIRNYGIIALIIGFSFITKVALAKGEKMDTPVAELKYLGVLQNQPVFQLNLNSAKEEVFAITIKDQSGEVLYAERLKTKTFVRTFRLDIDNLDDAVLRIEVRNGNNKPEIFTINRNTRYYEETSISKL